MPSLRHATIVLGLIAAAPAFAAPPAPAQDLVAKGQYLATVGDCVSCHSAPGGKPFAGGLAVDTPFGKIVSPNITPDKDTGIGNWSDDQFYAAMHEGLGKGGEYLYPAMPFTSYTKVTRDDVMAIKAYIFSLPPVSNKVVSDTLPFPFSVRESLAVWRAMFFRAGTFEPDPKKSAQINRGAYLVQGLGHCAECHSQRNVMGGIKTGTRLEGGVIDGWYAPNITSDMRGGIGKWSENDLVAFLKTGTAKDHSVVLGPMSEVVHRSLAGVTDADLHAMAAYLKSTPAKADPTSRQTTSGKVFVPGEAVYLNNCAGCHQLNGEGLAGRIPALAGNGAVLAAGAQDVLGAVYGGIGAQGSYGPMPAFGGLLSDQDIADVANYVRTAWKNGAPANAAPGQVAELAKKIHPALSGPQASCPPPPAGGAALSDPKTGITAMLGSIDQSNMLPSVDSVLTKTRATLPDAAQADVVNGLIAAYCPTLAANTALDPMQRRDLLNRFGQLVYSQLVTGGGTPGHKN